jgi:hypothetical protein
MFAMLAVTLLIAAGCTGPNGSLSLNAYTQPVISPLLAGIADSVLPSYYRWFNTPNNPDTPNPLQMGFDVGTGTITGITDNASSIVMLDPACGLSYAWDKMQNSLPQQGQYNDQQPIGLASAGRPGYNPATQQVLVLMRGYSIGNPSSSSDYTAGVLNACSKREAGYIPLILDLVSGRWNIDGLASPGATINIRMSIPVDMSPVDAAGQLVSQDTIVSPLRLTRFEVNASNFARIQKFATVSSSLGLARQVSWFRTSDINPDYTYSNLNTNTCIPFLAFWGAGGAYQELNSPSTTYGKASCPQLAAMAASSSNYYSDEKQRNATNSYDYIDSSWRQSDNGGNLPTSASNISSGASDTAANMDNDDAGKVSVGPLCPIPVLNQLPGGCIGTPVGGASNQFKNISGDLEILALTASKTDDGHPLQIKCDPAGKDGKAQNTSGMTDVQTNRANAYCDIQQNLFVTYGGSAYLSSEPSGDLASWESLPSDVFGLLSDNGPHARDITVDTIHDQPYAQGLNGFVGAVNPSGNLLHTVETTITPSMSVISLKTDAAQAAFYQKYSFLLSPANTIELMSFSTADPTKTVADPTHPDASPNTAGIPYVQGPLLELEITVSNTLDITNTATYSSDYIPLYALNRNGPDVGGVNVNYNPLTQFGQAVTQAVNSLIYNIYSATVGSWTSSLTHGATQNLFALPMLTQYQVLYYNNGNPVYAHSDLVLNAADYNALVVKAGGSKVPKLSVLSQHERDEYTCSVAAQSQNFTSLTANPDSTNAYSMCLAQDPFFSLWDFFRSLSILLMVLLIARYFFGLISFETGQIRPVGFLARVFIAMGLTLGMNIILGILARGVAETILITNIVGTNLSGGSSYSFLWLFADYLRAPAHDLSVLSALLLFPFTAIGLLFLIVSSWLRVGVALFVVCLAPIWVFSLLTDRQMKVFTSGISMLFRLYLVPMAGLVILLALFLVSRVVGLDPTSKSSLYSLDIIGAIIRMLFMVALAIVPWFLAKYLAIAPVAALKTAIAKTTEMADHSGANAWLEAGASGVAALNSSNSAKRKEEQERIEGGEKGDAAKALEAGEDGGTGDGEEADKNIEAGEAAQNGPSLLEGGFSVVEDLAAGTGGDKKLTSGEAGEAQTSDSALTDPLADEAEAPSGDSALDEGDDAAVAALSEGEGADAALGEGEGADALGEGEGADAAALGEGDSEELALGEGADADSLEALGPGDDVPSTGDEVSDNELEAGEADPMAISAATALEAEAAAEADALLSPEQRAQVEHFDRLREIANSPDPEAAAAAYLAEGGSNAPHAPLALDDAAKLNEANDIKSRAAQEAKALRADPASYAASHPEWAAAHPEEAKHFALVAANRKSHADGLSTVSDAATSSGAASRRSWHIVDNRYDPADPTGLRREMAILRGDGRLAVSDSNRGNRPRFMDRFGTKTQKALRIAAKVSDKTLHGAAIATDFHSIKADWVGTATRPGSLRAQGRLIRNAGLLSTITGTAFVERVSTAELGVAHEMVKSYNDPAKRQEWLARDPDAKRLFGETEAQIKLAQQAVKKNPGDPMLVQHLTGLEGQREQLLAAAQPDPALARQYAEAQQTIAAAKELGGAGTNFGRAMAAKTAAFQADVAAYHKNDRADLSDEMMDPRRWAVRLAANSQTGVAKAKDTVLEANARWDKRQQDAAQAQAEFEENLARQAMARADAEASATARGALVNDIAGHLAAGQPNPYANLAAVVDDPAAFAASLEKERRAAQNRINAAQKPYTEIDAQLSQLYIGGRSPVDALVEQKAREAQAQAEMQAADEAIKSLSGTLGSSLALPATTRNDYQAQLVGIQERREAAAAQAVTAAELAHRAAGQIPNYQALERQRAATTKARAQAGSSDLALVASLDELAAKAADPANREAVRESVRRGHATVLSNSGSAAQAYRGGMETIVAGLAQAQVNKDAAARVAGEQARTALLASAKTELGPAGATRVAESLREGVEREAARLRAEAKTSTSYEKRVELRAAPPIFSVMHPRQAISQAQVRHVASANESVIYARHRAEAEVRLASLASELPVLEETAKRNARDGRADAHAAEALAGHQAAIAREEAILEGVRTHDQQVALVADQRRAERLKYREKLLRSTNDQYEALNRQLERVKSAQVIWNQIQEAAIHGQVDSDAVERRRVSYEQEVRLARAEAEKLRRLEIDQQDFLTQSD